MSSPFLRQPNTHISRTAEPDHGRSLHGATGRAQGADGLFYDYRTNVALYPKWQEFLRSRQPKSLIFWGQDDIFFTREGGEAYLKDLPNAEMHRLDSGHFAVEDCLDYIAMNILRFYDEKVAAR